ncbi:MAG: iron-containing alcohol dehydrogenase, partial [Ferruginibacter sp.]
MITIFNAPSSIVAGAGASGELLNQVKRLNAGAVLFITDPFITSTGLIDRLQQPLIDEGIKTFVFNEVQADPTVDNVLAGLKLLNECGGQLLIAVGGGSPIDTAKAISILKTNPQPLKLYMGYHKIPKAGMPVIAIPTTAGTGSEATKVAVITDTEANLKMMLLDNHLMPSVALVDYELTMTMPKPLTAYVGVDTLTHGIEAYVSRKANFLTDPIALSCVELVADNLIPAWEQPANKTAREAMSIAACQGGMAFTNSSVCLVHGMSRPLGVQFHLPHGLSNAVLLPAVTKFSIAGAVKRYAKIAGTMKLASTNDSDESACNALVKGLEEL